MNIRISGDTAVRQQLQAIGKQMPFALSVALNGTANAVQQAVRGGLGEKFTLRRRTFVERTIFRDRATDFATKTKPQATVRVNPSSDFLAKFEKGDTKTPRDGRSIAIPTVNARRTKSDIVTTANRPRALLDKPGHFRFGDVLYATKGRGKRQKLIALFVFKRSARIRPRLGMEDTAGRVVPDVWELQASRAIERALSTAR
ncbi:hypothetical protein [Gemmatimonas sp.]|uniref:hypothetical protein n=1 Tax=Gemmatimonas sp. TaxID=1962908 RepID=UPI003DA5C79C